MGFGVYTDDAPREEQLVLVGRVVFERLGFLRNQDTLGQQRLLNQVVEATRILLEHACSRHISFALVTSLLRGNTHVAGAAVFECKKN